MQCITKYRNEECRHIVSQTGTTPHYFVVLLALLLTGFCTAGAQAAFVATLTGSTATMTGDSAADTLNIDQFGGFLRHNRFAALDPGFASEFDFDSTVVGEQRLSASAASTLSVDTGTGNDIVVFGSSSEPASRLLATINYTGGSGDTQGINDSGNSISNIITYNGSTITGTGINVNNTGIVSNIAIRTGAAADTVNVLATIAGETLSIDDVYSDLPPGSAAPANAIDTITIGGNTTPGTLGMQAINGVVAITNDASAANVILDDSLNTAVRTPFVSAANVVNLAPAPITYFMAALRSLTVKGGSGSNAFTVVSTPASTIAQTPTTLDTGTGADAVNVITTDNTGGASLVINGQSGSDSVNLGLGGITTNILAAVSVTNAAGSTSLTVDNSINPNSNVVNIAAGQITGIAPGIISFTAPGTTGAGVNAVRVNSSASSDAVTVTPSTATSITVDGGGQPGDSLAVAGGTAATSGRYVPSLTVGNGVITHTYGAETATVNFEAMNTVSDTVTDTDYTINGSDLGSPFLLDDGVSPSDGLLQATFVGTTGLQFQNKTNVTVNGGLTAADGADAFSLINTEASTGLTTLTVNGGPGTNGGNSSIGDSFFVVNTVAGVNTVVNGDNGADSVTVGNMPLNLNTILGAVTVNGNGGTNDSLNLVDQTAGNAQTYELTSSSLTRAGIGTITYGTTEAVTFYAADIPGLAANTITIGDNATSGTGTVDTITVQGGNGVDNFTTKAFTTATLPSLVTLNGGLSSDTFDITPGSATTYNVVGGQPTPPTLPGDTIGVNVSGASNPILTSAINVNGLSGSYTFGNRQPVSFQEIETATPVSSDLSITATDGAATAVAGSTVTYTVAAANNGANDITGATISDVYTGILSDVSYTSTATGGATGNTASGTGTINDTVNLPAGSTITYTVTATIDPTATGTVGYTANIATPTGVSEANIANNTATDTDTLVSQADVAITKTVSGGSATVGNNLTYTITATNNGPSQASDVAIADALPAGTTFVSAAQSAGPAFSATTPAVGANGTVNATIATLAKGASATFEVVVRVTSSNDSISNTATIATTTDDPNAANNTATAVTDTVPSGLSVNDVAVAEGNSGTVNAAFTVSLTPASVQTVTVNYATADGTATAGSDYQATNGQLTFAPGETVKTINVPVNGDTADEADETFSLVLSAPVNATLADATGIGTITDDDVASPTPTPTATAQPTPTAEPTPSAPDTLAPQIAFTAPQNGARLTHFAVLAGNVEDVAGDNAEASGVQSVLLTLRRSSDGRYWTGTTWTLAPTTLSTTLSGSLFRLATSLPTGENARSGLYITTAVATDEAGNKRSTAIAFYVLDRLPPRLSIDTPRNGQTLTQLKSIGGQLIDEVTGFGPLRVLLTIRRSSDGRYWNGANWVVPAIALASSIQIEGSRATWVRDSGLPTVATGTSEVLTIAAAGYDKAGNRTVRSIQVTLVGGPAPTT